jgi:hypothetical protein
MNTLDLIHTEFVEITVQRNLLMRIATGFALVSVLKRLKKDVDSYT